MTPAKPSPDERAERLARRLAERTVPCAFDESTTQRTVRAILIEALVPPANVIVQMGEALQKIATTNCALPHMRTCPGCAGCIARAALSAYEALMSESK